MALRIALAACCIFAAGLFLKLMPSMEEKVFSILAALMCAAFIAIY